MLDVGFASFDSAGSEIDASIILPAAGTTAKWCLPLPIAGEWKEGRNSLYELQ